MLRAKSSKISILGSKKMVINLNQSIIFYEAHKETRTQWTRDNVKHIMTQRMIRQHSDTRKREREREKKGGGGKQDRNYKYYEQD